MDKVILKTAILTIALLLKDVSSNMCKSKQTCGECIAEHSQCAWCSQENFGYNGSPRCDYVWNLVDNHCDYEYINNPMDSLVILQNEELGQGYYTEGGVHQVRPQEIKIALRPNSVKKLRVEYIQTEDYPLDIYVFMDLSTVFDKQKMVQLGHKLAEELPNITSNFRVGFGTFVYKPRGSCPGCTPSYVFQNVMSLSFDTIRFSHMIEEAPGSVNMDAPDGGVDAIMKAIVCKEEIGWRLFSRKILLYVSDNYYNYTVHGQLDEKATRNPDICYLDSSGYFSERTGLDYPSPSLIDYHINKNDMHIIFAVTSHQRPLYHALSKDLNDSSIGTLDGDLANIIDLVRELYDNTRSSVVMKNSVIDHRIKLTYYSKCLGSKLEKTNICKELKKGSNVTFEVEIELTACPPKHIQIVDKIFNIYPIGVRSSLRVSLELLCECDCEKHGTSEINSPKCHGYGTFECGICTCNDNSFGKHCECSGDISSLSSHLDCKINANDAFSCSGRGDCVCGACNCVYRENPNEIVYGRLCECDNFSCDTHDGELCSDHGTCNCGQCMCRRGWTGSDCSCRDDDLSCFNEKGELCSGHGTCQCGSCVCEDIDGKRYFGEFCEETIDDTPANKEEDASFLDGIYLLLLNMGQLR